MRTKEIDVYIEDTYLERGKVIYGNYHRIWTCGHKPEVSLKAKLIIEIPEKKIEITESDLLRAFRNVSSAFTVGYAPHDAWKEELMEELGFKDE